MGRARKFLAVFLVFCMVLGVVPADWSAVTAEAAEADGISSGSTYILKSALNQDYVLMPRDSKPGWTYVYLFDKTGSNSQKWVFTYNGSSYSAKNVGTDLTLHYSEGVKDAHVDQNGYDGTDFYKWNLIKVTSGAYSGGYMLEAVKEKDGSKFYLTADKNERGTELYLRERDNENPAKQIWYFEKTDNVSDTSVKREQVLEVSRAYLNQYFVDVQQSDGSNRKSLGGGFWVGAELCEMMLDGYETTGDNMYREAFESSYQDLLDNISERYTFWTGMTHEDWADNPFNDDIMWLVITSVRAYLLFGKGDSGYTDYLEYAKRNFKTVIDRGTLSDGTIRWSHESGRGEGTTSCINGPTVVAACYLAKATGDDSYYETAKKVHAAQRKTMFDANTGRVYDSPSSTVALTYNQGTWLGSCVMLYERYGDREYLDDAVKSMNFAMSDFCDNGIMKWEDAKTGADLPIFRSIFMRYVRKFIVEMNTETDVSETLKWMQRNAKVAYNNRNSKGLIHTPWHWATENDADYGSAGMSGAVSLLVNLPTYESTVNRNAYDRIEAEKFDYVKGIKTENTQDSDGNGQVAGVRREYYTGYANVDFGTKGAAKIELRVSTEKAGGSVEVHLDSPTGTMLGSIELPHTGSWGNYTTVSGDMARITGMHTIYLVFKKSDNEWVCNLNWLKFSEASDKEDGAVAIKSEASNKYFICNDGGNEKISANSENKSSWEQFKLIYNDDKTVSFQSVANKKYVCVVVDDGDTPYLIARSDTIGDWEKFKIESFGGESLQFAIKANANGKYLQVNPDSNDKLVTATGDQVGGAWETFNMETVDGAWIRPSGAISTYQVKYYKQNTDFGQYSEIEQDRYTSNGSIGVNVKAEEKTYAGFHINTSKSNVSGEVLENNQLVLNLYYDRNEYAIQYKGIDGISNADSLTKSYRYGESVTLKEAEKQGYIFEGWYREEEFKNLIVKTSEDMMADLTLYARFVPVPQTDPDDSKKETTYTVEYYKQNEELNGYIKDNDETLTAKVGDTVSPSDKTYEGFLKNESLSQGSGTVLAEGRLVLKVYYDRQKYEIRYTGTDGIGNADELPSEYVFGVELTLKEPSKTGYSFKGWFTDDQYTEKKDSIPAGQTGAIELFAKFEKDDSSGSEEKDTTYVVEYYKQNAARDGYEKEMKDTLTLAANVGDVVTSPDKDYAGYVRNELTSQKNGTIPADGRLVLKVYYDRREYQIHYMDIEGVKNADSLKNSYWYGESVTLENPEIDGYVFEGWYREKEYVNLVVKLNEDTIGDVTLYARFTDLSHTDPGNVGDETTYTVEYYRQSLQTDNYVKAIDDTLTTAAKVGDTVEASKKIYEGFAVNEALSKTSGTVLAGGRLVLRVYYDRCEYEIHYAGTEGISNVGELPSSYIYGTNLTLTEPIKEGYIFEGWYTDEACTDRIDSISAGQTGTVELFAKFKGDEPRPVATTYIVVYYKQNEALNGYVREDDETLVANVGDTVTPAEKTYEGFVKNELMSNESGTVLADGGLVLRVYYDREKYKIQYSGIEGISNAGALLTEYCYGVGVSTLMKPEKSGYDFEGWFADAAYTKKQETISAAQTGTVTLYAKFKKQTSGGNNGSGGNNVIIGDNNNGSGNQNGNGGQGNALRTVSPGDVINTSRFVYKVLTVNGKKGTLLLDAPMKKTYKSLTIPATVKYNDITFSVTSIDKDAFKNNKKLKSIKIGKNVTKIGNKAFYGCKNLKTVNMKGVNLKKVGAKAFIKTNKKLRIKAGSAAKVKKWKKLFKKKMPTTAKIVVG